MTPNTKTTAAAVVQTETLPDPGVPPRIRSPHRHPLSPCGHPPGAPSRVCEPHSLVLEHLRAIRAALGDHGQRLGRIELRLSVIEQTLGSLYAVGGSDREAMEAIVRRVERIERRLEIAG